MKIRKMFRFVAYAALIVAISACGGAEERKAKYMEKGKAYFDAGNYDKARVEFKNVVQIDPKYGEAFYYIGQLEEKNKDFAKAVGNYKKSIELDPAFASAKLRLAKIFVVIGTQEYLDQAKNLLGEVLASDPENYEARLIASTIEYKTGDKEKALEKIKQLVAKDYSLVEGVTLLSIIYVSQGKIDEAIHILEKGQQASPKEVPIRLSLAKLYAHEKKNDLAEKQLKEIIALKPDEYAFQVALSSFYSSSGQKDKAEQVLRAATDKNPDDVQPYLVLVEFLSKSRSIAAGEEQLKQFVSQHEDLVDLKFALAEFYKKLGRPDEAKQVLNKMISASSYDKDIVKANVELAKLVFEEKNIDDAAKYIEKATEISPNDNEALLLRGRIALINKDAEAAVNDLRTVVKNEPKNADAAALLATAHEMAGQSSLAEDVLRRAMEVNPVNDVVHYNYARYLIKMGRVNEARQVVDKAMGYFQDSYKLAELNLKFIGDDGNQEGLLHALDDMKKRFPDKAEVDIKKGQYLASKKQWGAARKEFMTALGKSSDKFTPVDMIVSSYLAEKKPQEAIDWLNGRLAEKPDDAVSLYMLGRSYAASGDENKALDYFRKATAVNASWALPYMGVGGLYIQAGDTSKALDVYNDALSKVRDTTPIRLQLATMFERERDYQKAMEQYRALLEVQPSNLLAANNLASLLVESSASEADIAKALELTRGFDSLQQPAFLDTLGWVYVKAGRFAEAVSVMQKVVAMAPNVAIFNYHYGVALQKVGRPEEARSYLQQAIDSQQEFLGKEEAKKIIKDLNN